MFPPKTTPSTPPPPTWSLPEQRERSAAGSVIPFVAGAGRRFRREADEAPRGQILLFTGVRYERLPEAAPVPQRRRS
ncbi:Transposase [Methylorubrum populi]